MRIIDICWDSRLNGCCVTIVCDYRWYLAATAGAEENLSIQRSIIKGSKAYRTLRADLKRGCILPPLVLAVARISVSAVLTEELILGQPSESQVFREIEKELAEPRPTDTYIIDGLQRTNALRQTQSELNGEALDAFLKRSLRVELWLNMPFGAIAYRMLLLNAGQKPMSMKHQVEVLSMKLGDDLAGVSGIDILRSLDNKRRTRAGQFSLAKLAQAFQAWLQGSPNIDIKNSVMEQLLAESAIDTLGTSLCGAPAHDDFKSLVQWFVDLDLCVWSVDNQFFGNETVLLGISAAVGAAQRNDKLRDRMIKSLAELKTAAVANPEVLAIERFNELRQGVETRKVNVGQYTRDLVFHAFQEYVVSDGNKSMDDCWAFGASRA